MNRLEKQAFKWLIKQGIDEKDITFRSNKTPDFVISNGRKYEVKDGRGKKTKNILIHDKQYPDLIKDSNTKILVFEKNCENPTAIIPVDKIKKDTWKIGNISISWRKFNPNTITYGLKIEDKIEEKIWEDFRKTLRKDDIINKVIIEMIKKRIEEFQEK